MGGKCRVYYWVVRLETPACACFEIILQVHRCRGLDSVSNRCSHHFTWSDWMGILPPVRIPPGLVGVETGTDTLSGRYSPSEIWSKSGDRITVDINVLADTASRKWVPNLSVFFNDDIDFEQFRLRLNYGNVAGDSIGAVDLAGYSFNIESNGRGHGMFRFNRRDEPFFVSTYAEVYVMDKEYISVKEAKNGIGANLMQARLKYWNRLMRRICNRPYRLLSIGSTPLTMTASDCRLSRTAGWPGATQATGISRSAAGH